MTSAVPWCTPVQPSPLLWLLPSSPSAVMNSRAALGLQESRANPSSPLPCTQLSRDEPRPELHNTQINSFCLERQKKTASIHLDVQFPIAMNTPQPRVLPNQFPHISLTACSPSPICPRQNNPRSSSLHNPWQPTHGLFTAGR